jgi:hypothetical protein
LLEQYKKLKSDEKVMIEEVGKLYGYGKLNLEKGELTINIDETVYYNSTNKEDYDNKTNIPVKDKDEDDTKK